LFYVVTLCFVAIACCASADDTRNVTQIIQARGYPVEDRTVTTSDGFILSLQRITGAQHTPGTPNVQKPVVLLQHGLLDSSFTWVSQEIVSESLGFILADKGYDVWLSNVRGNTYSDKNTHYSPKDQEFWAWTFDEMAHIDLPTVLNYILGVTKQNNLSYVGHSQGTTMGFIAFENPAIAKLVNIFVALAPVAWVDHTTSELLKGLADIDAQVALKYLGMKAFAPDTAVLKILLPTVCSKTPDSCANIMGLVMGWDTTNLNTTRLPTIMAHEPSGTSTQNIIHWAQEVRKNVFEAYDYGNPSDNLKHYNSTTPPAYKPGAITLPIALFSGGQDALADPTDVAALTPLLKNVVYNHIEPSYAHLDFVWGVNAHTLIYPQVVEYIGKYASK